MKRVRSISLLAAMLACSALLFAPAAHAEGPGYGGTADSLDVSWEEVPETSASSSGGSSSGGGAKGIGAAVRAQEPRLVLDRLALVVRGLGFRANSEVLVMAGTSESVSRASSAGELELTLPPTDEAAPGMTIIATGRNQSGTEVSLLGSIPPKPSGGIFQQYAPWFLLLIGASWAAIYGVKRARKQSPA